MGSVELDSGSLGDDEVDGLAEDSGGTGEALRYAVRQPNLFDRIIGGTVPRSAAIASAIARAASVFVHWAHPCPSRLPACPGAWAGHKPHKTSALVGSVELDEAERLSESGGNTREGERNTVPQFNFFRGSCGEGSFEVLLKGVDEVSGCFGFSGIGHLLARPRYQLAGGLGNAVLSLERDGLIWPG